MNRSLCIMVVKIVCKQCCFRDTITCFFIFAELALGKKKFSNYV